MKEVTFLGSMFFSRQISGVKIIVPKEEIIFCGHKFKNYGSSSNNYPNLPYICFAAAIGITLDDIDKFVSKTEDILNLFKKSIEIPKIIKKLNKK
jgi:O-phospho-L-seryl-tRNASec:L-selenocysteinyl-tRNA synthase